jgi:hypothetical protein
MKAFILHINEFICKYYVVNKILKQTNLQQDIETMFCSLELTSSIVISQDFEGWPDPI